jgi:glycerol-3-phosphate O-acyltransferase
MNFVNYRPVMKYSNVVDIDQWPINIASQKQDVIREIVINDAYNMLLEQFPHRNLWREMLQKTAYSEKYRIKNEAWSVDPKDDYKFWKKVEKQIYKTDPILMEEAQGETIEKKLVKVIIRRYVNEMMGKFDVEFYKTSVKTAPYFFGRLFNATADDVRNIFFPKTLLRDKIVNLGPIEKIRQLSTKGTIILLPTHFSNLDSMMIGYGLSNMGLPPFQYAAGLNLFNSKIFGFFMERLGAYKLDRRKKNAIYLQTLKSFSRTNILEGVHTLFFPGGTRSRSGAMEEHLKLGLVGTAIEAQRIHCERDKNHPKKIFILPLCMSYHFVLEAKSLIEEHLTKTGKELYITIDDEFAQTQAIAKFLWGVYKETSEISLSFGEPMDLFGNAVDMDGNSLDTRGNIINISHFFSSKGVVNEDAQREQEYTRQLGERILKSYLKINVVYASHLVAFVAFQILLKEHPKTELYSFLKIPPQKLSIEYKHFVAVTAEILAELYALRDRDELKLAPHMDQKVEKVIEYGLKNIGIYHAVDPIIKKGNKILTENLKLLYFYHNRLKGYDLERLIKRKT